MTAMLKQIALATLLYTSMTTIPSYADSEVSIGDISARVDDLEKRIKGENAMGDELATKEEVEQLITANKILTGRIEMLEHQLNQKGRETNSAVLTADERDPLSKQAVDDSPFSSPTDGSDEDTDVDEVLKSLTPPAKPKESKKEAAKIKTEEAREKATEKAEKESTSVLDSGSPAEAFNQAKGLLNKKQYAEAEEAFTEYLKTYPKSKEANSATLRLAQAQLHQKKTQTAKTNFAKAYKENGKGEEGAQALLGLSECLGAEKDKTNACTVLKKIKDDFPKNKEIIDKVNGLSEKYKCL
jgi:tol-pal system protein YbgF